MTSSASLIGREKQRECEHLHVAETLTEQQRSQEQEAALKCREDTYHEVTRSATRSRRLVWVGLALVMFSEGVQQREWNQHNQEPDNHHDADNKQEGTHRQSSPSCCVCIV